jgi:hypothetical protein
MELPTDKNEIKGRTELVGKRASWASLFLEQLDASSRSVRPSRPSTSGSSSPFKMQRDARLLPRLPHCGKLFQE